MTSSQLYDWHAVVAENKPGRATDAQVARTELLRAIAAKLAPWAERFDLQKERVEVSAYTAAVSTKLPPSLPEAFLIARLVLWSFTLDDYIDQAPLATDAGGPEGATKHLVAQLGALARTVLEAGNMHSGDLAYLLDLGAAGDAKIARKTLLLGDAWRDIYGSMDEAATSASGTEGRRFVLTNATQQAVEMLGSWRQEGLESIARQHAVGPVALPSMGDYLRRGALSIGFHYTATAPVAFETAPEQAWDACLAAMESGALISRLCNDIASYKAELAENKVNAVVIALAEMGRDPVGPRAASSKDLEQAKEVIRTRLEREIERFAHLSNKLPDGRLGFWVRTTPAFALAMYERGNYVEPA